MRGYLDEAEKYGGLAAALPKDKQIIPALLLLAERPHGSTGEGKSGKARPFGHLTRA
jgi:hypothetical protein